MNLNRYQSPNFSANFEPWPHGHFTRQVYSLNILCSKDFYGFYGLSRKGLQMRRTISSSRNFATALQGINGKWSKWWSPFVPMTWINVSKCFCFHASFGLCITILASICSVLFLKFLNIHMNGVQVSLESQSIWNLWHHSVPDCSVYTS